MFEAVGKIKNDYLEDLINDCQAAIDKIERLIVETEVFNETNLENLNKVKNSLEHRIISYKAGRAK